MRVSLIATTVDREKEVIRLLNSIKNQVCVDFYFDMILVDQLGIFNKSTLDEFQSKSFNIRHIVVDKVISLSESRNIALSYVCSDSDIICFPDDDCWYSSEFFNSLKKCFEIYKTDIICTNVFDPLTVKRYGNRPYKHSKVGFNNIFSLPISVGIFIKARTYFKEPILFDLEYGVGTKFGSGEETKFIIEFLLSNYSAHYVGDIFVYHPVVDYVSDDIVKYYNYGLGFGKLHRFLVQNNCFYSLPNFINVVFRSFVGLIICRDSIASKVYASRLKGLIKGFLC
jgi:hypothetical protein